MSGAGAGAKSSVSAAEAIKLLGGAPDVGGEAGVRTPKLPKQLLPLSCYWPTLLHRGDNTCSFNDPRIPRVGGTSRDKRLRSAARS